LLYLIDYMILKVRIMQAKLHREKIFLPPLQKS
jgi:hypothetical protein